jgi:hypothetical protein
MPFYYIYLPVKDLGLMDVADQWARKSPKIMEVIVHKSGGSTLKKINPASTVYVLAHGSSVGYSVKGPEAAARVALSDLDYSGLKKRFPKASEELEKLGYSNNDALTDALKDDNKYEEILEIVSQNVPGIENNKSLDSYQPGAVAIGGKRADGKSKRYTAKEFYKLLQRERLPQVPRLKIFACNAGITPAQGTCSFVESLYEYMKDAYPTTTFFGYLGAVTANYYQKQVFNEGKIPENTSEIWKRFHAPGGEFQKKLTKGVKIVEPNYKKIVRNGTGATANYEFIPAHALRVEFPGGQTVRNDMRIYEDDAKPW